MLDSQTLHTISRLSRWRPDLRRRLARGTCRGRIRSVRLFLLFLVLRGGDWRTSQDFYAGFRYSAISAAHTSLVNRCQWDQKLTRGSPQIVMISAHQG